MNTPATDPQAAATGGAAREPWERLLVALCMSYVHLRAVPELYLTPASRLCRPGDGDVVQLLGELEARGFVRDVEYAPGVGIDVAAGRYASESDEVSLVMTPAGDRAARDLIAAMPSQKRDLVLLAAYGQSARGWWRGWFAPGCLPLGRVAPTGEMLYDVHWREACYLAHQLCKLGDFDVKSGDRLYRLTRRGARRARRLHEGRRTTVTTTPT